MVNPIIIDRETGEKLGRFHKEVEDFIFKINERYSLNYYELVGVLETIIWGCMMMLISKPKKMNDQKLINKIKRRMVRGHDDFYHCWCIHFEDWDKIVKYIEKKNDN